MKVTSYTDLRQNLATHLDRVSDDHEPLLVTRANGAHAIVLSLEDYNALQETDYLLSDEANAQHLCASIANAGNSGKRTIKTLDDLKRMAE